MRNPADLDEGDWIRKPNRHILSWLYHMRPQYQQHNTKESKTRFQTSNQNRQCEFNILSFMASAAGKIRTNSEINQQKKSELISSISESMNNILNHADECLTEKELQVFFDYDENERETKIIDDISLKETELFKDRR